MGDLDTDRAQHLATVRAVWAEDRSKPTLSLMLSTEVESSCFLVALYSYPLTASFQV